MLKEFKDFISRGGIFEAAVGLIMALAFVPVVGALIDGVLMPIIAAIVGQPNFDAIGFDLGDARVAYGLVITQLVKFVSIAAVVFLLVKAYNKATKKGPDAPAGPSDNELLTQIRDSLAKR